MAELVNNVRADGGLDPVEAGHVTNRVPIGYSTFGGPIYSSDGSSTQTNFISGDPFTPVPSLNIAPFVAHDGRNGVADPFTTHVQFVTHEDPIVETRELGASIMGDSVLIPDVITWQIRLEASSLSPEHRNNVGRNGLSTLSIVIDPPATIGLCLANNNSGLIQNSIAEYDRYRANPLASRYHFDGTPQNPWVDSPITPVWQDNPAEVEVLMCNGQEVTVDLSVGQRPTNGNDVIRGTAGDDFIDALDGDDTICSLQGNDVIDGGDGFDKVFAGAGQDRVDGGNGNDRLVGGDGHDQLVGGPGNDRLQGGGGADVLFGGGGQDRIAGNNGNDVIFGGTHGDELFGNLGQDEIYGEGGNDVIRGGGWIDAMDGGAGRNDGCTLTDPGGAVETRVNCEGGVFGR